MFSLSSWKRSTAVLLVVLLLVSSPSITLFSGERAFAWSIGGYDVSWPKLEEYIYGKNPNYELTFDKFYSRGIGLGVAKDVLIGLGILTCMAATGVVEPVTATTVIGSYIIIPASTSAACRALLEHIDKKRTVWTSRNHPSLPPPRNDSGSVLYEGALEILKKYNVEKMPSNKQNATCISAASKYIERQAKPNDVAKKEQVLTLLALMQLAENKCPKARQTAEHVLNIFVRNEMARNPRCSELVNYPKFAQLETDLDRGLNKLFADASDKKYSLPLAIWSVASLGEENVETAKTLKALDLAVFMEPDNPFIPFLVSQYAHKLITERPDVMKSSHFVGLLEVLSVTDVPTETRFAAASYLAPYALEMAWSKRDYLRMCIRGSVPVDKVDPRKIQEAFDEFREYVKVAVSCFSLMMSNAEHELSREQKKVLDGNQIVLFQLGKKVAYLENDVKDFLSRTQR